MNILITGTCGFIGFALSKFLLSKGINVIGIDNINDYYCVELKNKRLNILKQFDNFNFFKLDIANEIELYNIFNSYEIDCVINLAAQAGVRYSIEKPKQYTISNLVGFSNILELCKNFNKKLIYASTSSVYGTNKNMPFNEIAETNTQMSFYAATKKCNEIMAQSYYHLFNMQVIGLRFFTVYGPWGRPDMALFKFTKAILNNEAIDVYNYGKMTRDLTYIDDIVSGIYGAINFSVPNYTDGKIHPIYNLGNGNPKQLTEIIEVLECALNKKAKKNFLDMQLGDVEATYSDISRASKELNYNPKTAIEIGAKVHLFLYVKCKKEWLDKKYITDELVGIK